MIRGHIALVRILRGFMEGSRLPWSAVKFRYEQNDDMRNIYDAGRAEMSFPYRGQEFEVVIYAPTDDPWATERWPLGRIACRCVDDGEVIKGVLDQSTWDQIEAMIFRKVDYENDRVSDKAGAARHS